MFWLFYVWIVAWCQRPRGENKGTFIWICILFIFPDNLLILISVRFVVLVYLSGVSVLKITVPLKIKIVHAIIRKCIARVE